MPIFFILSLESPETCQIFFFIKIGAKKKNYQGIFFFFGSLFICQSKHFRDKVKKKCSLSRACISLTRKSPTDVAIMHIYWNEYRKILITAMVLCNQLYTYINHNCKQDVIRKQERLYREDLVKHIYYAYIVWYTAKPHFLYWHFLSLGCWIWTITEHYLQIKRSRHF